MGEGDLEPGDTLGEGERGGEAGSESSSDWEVVPTQTTQLLVLNKYKRNNRNYCK